MAKSCLIFKAYTEICYAQIRFADGSLSNKKSTGCRNRTEAERTVMEWIVTGNIPERINSAKPSESKLNMDKLALFNNLKTYDFEEEDICKIIKILKDRKIIISAIRPKTKESILIDDILETFWNYEESPYVKSIAAETGKIIYMSYCKTCESRVRLYWLPALKGKYIGEITKDDLKSVLTDKRIQTLAPKTINGIIDSITIPLKWAFNEGYTENICYEGLRRKTSKFQKRHILTMDEAENLFHGDYWDNDAARVANMQIYEDLDMRLLGNTTKKANDKDNAKIKMVEVSQLRFERDFKNVFQQENGKVAEIANDMRTNGFDKSRPIIVTEAYIIVDGHSRFMAGVQLWTPANGRVKTLSAACLDRSYGSKESWTC